MKRFFICLCLTLLIFNMFFPARKVFGNEIDDSILETIDNLDLSNLEELYNDNFDGNFRDELQKILNGEYKNINDYSTFVLNILFNNVKQFLPLFIAIISICLILSIINSMYNEENGKIKKTVNYMTFFSFFILLGTSIYNLIKNTINFLFFLSKTNEIVSPILLTILSATGGSVSASIYNPTTIFITLFINNVAIKLILPIIILLLLLSCITKLNGEFNLEGYEDFFSSLIKWILGIVSLLFTIILTTSGISSGLHDGISLKATRYALTSSLPIIGGIIKDGFDFVIAGGIIVKNSIGLLTVFLIVISVLKYVIPLIIFSLLLKGANAIIKQFSFDKIGGMCISISKTITYLIALIIISSLLIIIYLFLIISTANVLF